MGGPPRIPIPRPVIWQLSLSILSHGYLAPSLIHAQRDLHPHPVHFSSPHNPIGKFRALPLLTQALCHLHISTSDPRPTQGCWSRFRWNQRSGFNAQEGCKHIASHSYYDQSNHKKRNFPLDSTRTKVTSSPGFPVLISYPFFTAVWKVGRSVFHSLFPRSMLNGAP